MTKPSSGAWARVGDVRRLHFETLDRFLGLPREPPEPWVLVDLSQIWVPGEGVPDHVRDEIERLALQAFRVCTDPDEWIWAWNAPDEYSDELYRFWPHRVNEPVAWHVSFYPDGDDQVFVSENFAWGIYAHFQCPPLDSWGLRVFGKRLLDAFAGNWPAGWGHIAHTSGVDVFP